ncbi:hypothetical protein [Bosea sp. 2RAB26]|uniref:hypothetical protein n=1 Tax=Bosea sp. 2RAB26 TaxID=3237476 RepID=UPI003F8F56CE
MSEIDAFLRDLSSLGRRYGFAFAGEPQIYRMEFDDFAFDYSLAGDSTLILGNSYADAGARTGWDAERRLDAIAATQVD